MTRENFLFGAIALTVALAWPTHSAFADEGRFTLNETEALIFTDAGFVTVEYIETAFGMTIRPFVEVKTGEDEATTRELRKADLKQACELLLASGDARLGRHAPDYVLFQITRRSVDLGLVDLKRTEDVFFETRRNRCKATKGPPEEVK